MTLFGVRPVMSGSQFFPPPVRVPVRKRVTTADLVVPETCREFGVTPEQLLGPSRLAWIVRARRHAARRLCLNLRVSTPKAGRILGSRDHTTIMNLIEPMALRRRKAGA